MILTGILVPVFLVALAAVAIYWGPTKARLRKRQEAPRPIPAGGPYPTLSDSKLQSLARAAERRAPRADRQGFHYSARADREQAAQYRDELARRARIRGDQPIRWATGGEVEA